MNGEEKQDEKVSTLLAALAAAGLIAGCGLTGESKSAAENPKEATSISDAKIANVQPGLVKSENNKQKILIAYFRTSKIRAGGRFIRISMIF